MSNSGVYSLRIASYNGIPTYGNGIAVDIYDVDNFIIPVTTATTVYSIPITSTIDCLVYVYIRVITSNTNTNAVLTWADESGPQTLTLTSGGLAVGGHPMTPSYLHMVAGTPLVLTVTTSNHANQVFITSDVYLM